MSKVQLLQKNVPTMKQMLGPDLKPEHKEHIEWAKKLPNSNWQIWATKAYKNSPSGLTPETKQKIEHFAGSQHIPEIAKVRFDKDHDIDTGISMLTAAEKSYGDRIKNNTNLVTPRDRTVKLINGVSKPDRHWFGLGIGSCDAEGKAMGHCGNVPSKVPGDKIISLRTEHNLSGKKYHEPHLTFISNKGFLGEMKGRGNEKPTKEYHKDIAELLKDKRIKGVLGGGYAEENNFSFSDLHPDLQKEVLRSNPNLITDTDTDKNVEMILSGGLAGHPKDLDVRRAIAENPNLDAKHHEKLVNDEDSDVRSAIARNPNLDAKHHEKLVNDEDWSFRRAIAENPNLDAKHHEKLVNDEDSDVRRAIAENPNLDAKHHEKLVNDEDSDVRRAIARNPNLDAKHHEKLVNDEDWGVRRAIARNPNLDAKHHEKLVNDEDSSVRSAAINAIKLRNKNLNRSEASSDILKKAEFQQVQAAQPRVVIHTHTAAEHAFVPDGFDYFGNPHKVTQLEKAPI